MADILEVIPNWIDGTQRPAGDGETLDKLNPHDGTVLCCLARSGGEDVAAAKAAQPAWAEMPPVPRRHLLHKVCNRLEERLEDVTRVVALETGKSLKDARGETGGAIALGRFIAGERQRLYGRTTTSGAANKDTMTVRQPCGVAGLIIAANTPIANVAWKVFPAIVCGNGAVLKAAEDTPATAWIFAEIAQAAGLPPGILNVVQELGPEAGDALVRHPDVAVVSFTGSSGVGREIARIAGERFAKVSPELGGKNPLVVYGDADLENAVKWTCLSAYSNAGQRCASGSRIIVFDAVYDRFRDMLVAATGRQKAGNGDDDDLGPVINRRQLDNMLVAIERAAAGGARVLAYGELLTDPAHAGGFYMAPTVIENVDPDGELSRTEVFGPIAALYRVRDFEEALGMANRSPYSLTAAIHTRSFDRAMQFSYKIHAGVAVVNASTYGSEPHMPFGGVKQSDNGSREPGTEALDIYSDLKDIYLDVDVGKL